MTIGNKQITKKFILKLAAYLAVAVVILGVATYIFLIQREKTQFAQAEKEIDALYAQVVEKVGKPDQERKEKTCDRPNLKFEKGPLSCSVSKSLLFENKDFKQSNEFMEKISTLGNEQLRIGSVASQGLNFTEVPRRNYDQVFFQNFSSETNLSCGFSFVYPAKEQDEFNTNPASTAFEVSFDCGGSAMMEYFPVKD